MKSEKNTNDNILIANTILPGVDRLFQTQRGATRKKRAAATVVTETTPSLKLPFKCHEKFDLAIKNCIDPDRRNLDALVKSYVSENATSWMWWMQCDRNLLLFGVGSKKELMQEFSLKYLDGEDVLDVDCSTYIGVGPNDNILRELLGTICNRIMKCKDVGSNSISIVAYAKTVSGASSFIAFPVFYLIKYYSNQCY